MSKKYMSKLLIQAITGKKTAAALDLIQQSDIDVDFTDDDGGYLIHKALENDLLMVVFALLEKGANIDARDRLGQTPLFWAAGIGHLELVKILCEQFNAGVNITDYFQQTPLFVASTRGFEDVVAFLLDEAGANPVLCNCFNQSALHVACFRGYTGIVKRLVEKFVRVGHSLDLPDDDGHTPMSAACYSGVLTIAKILLENGASLSSKSRRGFTPLTIAAQQGHGDILAHFTAAQPRVIENQANNVLIYISASNCKDTVDDLLRKNADIGAVDEDGKTPLMYACQGGIQEMVEFLLKKGADIHARDKFGRTALSYALIFQRKQAAAALLKFLTAHDLNRSDIFEYTSLHYLFLFFENHELLTMMEMFLEKGVDFDDFQGRLPLLTDSERIPGENGLLEIKPRVEKFMLQSIKHTLSREVDPGIRRQCQSFIRSHPPISGIEKFQTTNPRGYRDMMALRIKPSMTLSIGMKSEALRYKAIKAWLQVEKMVAKWAGKEKNLTVDDLLLINKNLDVESENPGKLRTIHRKVKQNFVKSYISPRFLKPEMDNFFSWLHETLEACDKNLENPIVLAARAEQKLSSLHPFENANGRTGRMVMDYILQRFQLPPALIGDNCNNAVFGLLPGNPGPTDVVKSVLEGIRASYRLLL